VFHIVGFVGGFRGEEMPMLSLDAMAKYLAYDQLADPKLAHVMIALRGKVKGERKAEACHLVQIVAVTKSGLKPRLWVQRAVEAYHRMGITNGWMFRDSKGAPSRQKDYEQLLFALIQEVIENEPPPERLLPFFPRLLSYKRNTELGDLCVEGMLHTRQMRVFRTRTFNDSQDGGVSRMLEASRPI
jgi:hypothetical protein